MAMKIFSMSASTLLLAAFLIPLTSALSLRAAGDGLTDSEKNALAPFMPLRWYSEGSFIGFWDVQNSLAKAWKNSDQAWVPVYAVKTEKTFRELPLATVEQIRRSTGQPGLVSTLSAAGTKIQKASSADEHGQSIVLDNKAKNGGWKQFGKVAEEVVSENLTKKAAVDKKVAKTSKAADAVQQNQSKQLPTFVGYYEGVGPGRGIWKWNNALVAYDRHLSKFKGKAVIGAEVGVQSGGSMDMWHAVLGDQAVMHGLDINPKCRMFADERTTITIGDQEDTAMWSAFFRDYPHLDFLVDDGGHEANQMLVTTKAAWPNLNPGGVLFIEDIHGQHYLDSFFRPLAAYIGGSEQAASVHLYPYLVGVQKQGPGAAYDPSAGKDVPAQIKVESIFDLTKAVHGAPRGSLVVFESSHALINEVSLAHIFEELIGLFAPLAMPDDPHGCAKTSANKCIYGTTNSPLQMDVVAAHILATKVVVEVASSEPTIEAVRQGEQWITYR